MPTVTDYTGLLSGNYWTGIETTGRPVFVTYSFPTISPAPFADADKLSAATATFQAFSAAAKDLVRTALAEWGDASGLTFLEVKANEGDLTFSSYDFSGSNFDGAGGIGYFPFGDWDFASQPYFWDHTQLGGDTAFNRDFFIGNAPHYDTLLHEIGHAIGLKHPFEVYGAHDQTLDASVDDTAHTVMSYNGGPAAHLGPLDLDAAEAVYGDAASDGTQVLSWSWNATSRTLTQTGFSTADVIQGVSTKDKIAAGGGNDKVFALAGNDLVKGGGGHDLIYGGRGIDDLRGDGGNDSLHGGADNDKLDGGAGNDLLYGDAGNDSFNFRAKFKNDIIADFTHGADKIDLSKIPGVNGIADIGIAAYGTTDTLITVGTDGTIWLWGVLPGALSETDFVF